MTETRTGPDGTVDVGTTGDAAATEWYLVIVFHPDTTRIGHCARLPRSGAALELGRCRPLFQSATGDIGRGIDDAYVSRDACRLESHAGAWRLRIPRGRSRVRIDGRDAEDGRVFSCAQLRHGLTLSLGHRVVLHLRQRSAVDTGNEPALPGLLGVSGRMHRLREAIHQAARSAADVLLTGPTGSGKERVARSIHALSDCAAGPWVAVNMAALPPDIAAASLFGARRGAYTGADRHRAGFFQQAAGGTLFLDEVGDTPASLQPMLLRALQEREVQVVGGPVERVVLRVISATERPLEGPDSRFRAALRYRLGALEIQLPALNERREDLGLLAAHFFRAAARDEQRRWLAEQAGERELARWARLFELLCGHDWPGNVRELEHAVAQIHGASTERLAVPESLARRLAANAWDPAGSAGRDDSPPGVRDAAGPRFSLAELPDPDFLSVWRDSAFEPAAAARRLGVSRAAVYRRLKRMEECRLAADVPLAELLAALEECRGDLRATATRLAVSRRGLETRLRASGVTEPGAAGPASGGTA